MSRTVSLQEGHLTRPRRFGHCPAIVGVLLLLALGTDIRADGSSRDDGWDLFVPSEGDYSIRMPGRPRERTEKADTELGKVNVQVVMSSHRDLVFAVDHQDDRDLPPAQRESYLDAMRDGHVRGKRGRLTREQRFMWEGHSGRDLTIMARGGSGKAASVHRIRLIFIQTRLYELMVVAPQDRAAMIEPDVERFFQSFALRDPQAVETWKVFRSTEGRFSVSMPGTPKQKRLKDAVDPDAPEIVTFIADGKEGSFIISYHDLSAAAVRKPGATLDATLELALESSKGTLLSSGRVALGRNPGREFTAEVPLGDEPKAGHLRCRIFLVGRRIYQVMAIAPKTEATSKAIDDYFKSFKLIQ